ncbi:MAG: acyl-CoA ligase (AMP-forming), exosortase A system-associated [Gammaproteobacteria bacterium]|nr:acyl-CoA ligase (AMP-forming), exosortase A system-associated [Gammaproteobacteria bacterium]
MSGLLHQLVAQQARHSPDAVALQEKQRTLTYASLNDELERVSGGLIRAGLERDDRVAIFLPKQLETVIAMFATSHAGGVFVPINPQLKPAQVRHILTDCDVRILVTSAQRLQALDEVIDACPALETIVLTDEHTGQADQRIVDWQTVAAASAGGRRRIDMDLAALLYTSGSTGRPKGVMLSQRNMVCGAHSVAEYLHNEPADRLLTVLPFSFDYGLSQLTTAFAVGATVVLFDYLLPRDVVRAVAREEITGLAGVPPLWNQLAQLEWPGELSLRYITNSGGAMPVPTLDTLRQKLPDTDVYLMYGLTEAFRSTYLDPGEVERRPGSMGKAIPNAEVVVVRPDGTLCNADEPGELVHRGSLVSLGYWNDPEKTSQRFRPAPQQLPGSTLTELAVWSGDTVKRDAEGFLYFVGRTDEMIKTSGFRVSPAEVEEILSTAPGVVEAAAVGVGHPDLGQAIVAAITGDCNVDEVLATCRREMPSYMVPAHIELADSLPRNPNGKIDRPALASRYRTLFEQNS